MQGRALKNVHMLQFRSPTSCVEGAGQVIRDRIIVYVFETMQLGLFRIDA
jgi:hypothetical protein